MSDAGTTPISGRQAASSPTDGPEQFPRTFGQYLLLENFARGGMGEVYLAKLGGIAGLEKYCVLKKLRPELTRDREYVTRFIDEARVVVTLNHANICHVFDVGRVVDEYYLAMEYISGRDLRVLQDRARMQGKQLPAPIVLHVACEILEALDYAHRRKHPLSGEALNLVHRDVSPQNVLVSYEGETKLIDFGLAASKLKVERTQPNIVMGKMAYMAPEQARGDAIDARADLFAAAVVCYELLSGERFYEGMSANDIWQVAGRGGFVPGRWRSLEPDLAKILGKALHADATKRFATCSDFREAIASYLHARHPGIGVRSLRDLMSEVFEEELARERDMLARFGAVTLSSFRTSLEVTKSHSITVARSDVEPGAIRAKTQPTMTVLAPDPTPATGAGVPRNVSMPLRTALDSGSGGSMPPPDLLQRDTTIFTGVPTTDPSQGPRDLLTSPTMLDIDLPGKKQTVHDERTRLAHDGRQQLPPRDQRPEPTEIVSRSPGRTANLVRTIEATEPPAPARSPRHRGAIAGALVAVLLLVGTAFVLRERWLPTDAPLLASATVDDVPAPPAPAPTPAPPPVEAAPPPPAPVVAAPAPIAAPVAAPAPVEPSPTSKQKVAAEKKKAEREKKAAAATEKRDAAPPPPTGPTSWRQLSDSQAEIQALAVKGCPNPCKGAVLSQLPSFRNVNASDEVKNLFKQTVFSCAKECGVVKGQ